MLACLLSDNPSKIKEYQRLLLSSSWPPGEMEQRNNTVPTLQSGKRLESEANQSHSAICSVGARPPFPVIAARSYIQCHQYSQKCYITLENGTNVGQYPLVSWLMKGIFQEKPPRQKSTQKFGMCPLSFHTFGLYPLWINCP